MTQYITVRTGRAFTCDVTSSGYRARVEADGSVSVYDSVTGHYTLCHALTDAQIRYIRRAAARAGGR